MKASSVKYLIKEGTRNTWSNRLMSFASIGILASCLLLLGVALLISFNITHILADVTKDNKIQVYMPADTTQEQLTATQKELGTLSNVESVELITKAQALEIMKEQFGEDKILLEGLEKDNPLVDSFKVKVKDMAQYGSTVTALKGMNRFEKINDYKDLAEQLTAVKKAIYLVGSFIIVLLLVISLFIISNTIKLAMFVRRREVNIMKYVGATNMFIRLPFIVEGLLLGLLSALLSFGLLYVIYSIAIRSLSSLGFNFLAFSQAGPVLLLGFCVLGIASGVLASIISIRKYLKV